jgi:uncharacterized membrane protein required for colicin V production
MGMQFFWFYDVLLVGILLGVTYKCTRKGFVAGVTNFVGTLLGFAIALGVSAPAASHLYDRFVSPGVVGQISVRADEALPDNAVSLAFDTLRNVDMSQATIDGVPMLVFLSNNRAGADETLKLTLDGVDLSNTGIADGDLRFFGLDAAFDFSFVNVGMVDLSPSDRRGYDLEDIILARTVSRRIAELAETQHSTLTRSLIEVLPGVTRATVGNTDLVARFMLNVINNDAEDMATAIDTYMVRPMTVLPFRLLIFAVVFTLTSVIVSAISKAAQLIEHIPLVGKVNSVFGSLMGLIFSAVIVGIIVVAVQSIIALTGNNVIFLNTMTVEQTYIFRHVYNFEFLTFSDF